VHDLNRRASFSTCMQISGKIHSHYVWRRKVYGCITRIYL
jgi:uncharacterized protein involved in tolerance to divalent cations